MTTHQMHDLKIETLCDGTVRLEQRDVTGGAHALIDLHPDQLVLVAKFAAVAQTDPAAAAISAENRRLRRRLIRLNELIWDFVGADYYRSEIFERCGQGMEIITVLDALHDVSEEFVADLDDETALARGAAHPGRAETGTASLSACSDENKDPAASASDAIGKPAAEGQMSLAGVE